MLRLVPTVRGPILNVPADILERLARRVEEGRLLGDGTPVHELVAGLLMLVLIPLTVMAVSLPSSASVWPLLSPVLLVLPAAPRALVRSRRYRRAVEPAGPGAVVCRRSALRLSSGA